jgi:RNA polymerase sigma factor for flagellar operon FliA
VTRTQAARPATESVQKLWAHYHATGDTRLRDRLVLTLAPMVKYIVYRKVRELPVQSELEDFLSCGLEALIRSIDRYDPSRGPTLEQFAWTRIHGAVLDELRRNDWAPRSLRRWEREIVKAREAFVATHGQPPTRAQLAAALGLSEAVLEQRLIDLERSEVGSLNVVVTGEEDSISERIDTLASEDRASDPVGSLLRDQAKVRFRAAFARLPERERQVAILLYVHSLTLREIGDVLGVTESRVCQLHAQLRRHLRDQLVTEQQLFSDVA